MNFETRLFNCADLQSILDCVLDGGLELTDANLGNVKQEAGLSHNRGATRLPSRIFGLFPPGERRRQSLDMWSGAEGAASNHQ